METIVLCAMFMLLVSTGNFLFVLGSVCDELYERHDGVPVFVPTNCSPTKCAATGFNEITTEDFQCSIGSTNACKVIKHAPSPPVHTEWNQVLLHEICQASLESISLYMFHCKLLLKPEVSLNFSFQLPLCGRNVPGSSASAVMVDFNAKRSADWFASYPMCRVFNFSGNDLSDFRHGDSILVSYECLAIGLEIKVPESYYYLAFTAYPTAVLLNYTIVFKHVHEESMQLMAAAWRSTSRVHVVFQPISGITEYIVTVECVKHENISKHVSSLQSDEITDIPVECHKVTVFVEPLRSQCESKELICSPIKVTLQDKSQLPLPVEQKIEENRTPLTLILIITVVVVLVTLMVIVGCLWRRNSGRNTKTDGFDSVGERKVLCIAICSSDAQQLKMDLKKRKFGVTDALQENIENASMLRGYDAFLIFIRPSLPDSDDFRRVLVNIFENQGQLLANVKVVSFDCAKPSQVLQFNFNNDQVQPFLEKLDQNTYNMPEDRERLFNDLARVDHHGECEHLLQEEAAV